jgi:ubiquinone/menaquinone biosynthesis C-methylase UbiE
VNPEPVLPRTFSAETVRLQYGRVAWFYDVWSRLTESRALARLVERSGVRDGSRILEVAVGTGRLFARLASINPSGWTEGVDLSPAMLEHARSRVARLGPKGRYRLREGDAYDLPFEAETFDFVFNAYMLDLLPAEDHPRLLGGFRRVLKPGGTLALASFSFGTARRHRFWIWLAMRFPALLTGCRPVRLEPLLETGGFEVLAHEAISENTFPSAVLVARKAAHGAVHEGDMS